MAILSTLSPFLHLLYHLPLLLLLPLTTAYLLPRQISTTTEEGTELVASSGGICLRPAPWNQILVFFITNYLARAATFKKRSGYEGFRDYYDTIISLFVPFHGISAAAGTISRGSRFLGKDDVERALLAKALTVIVRENGWRPQEGEIVRGCIVDEPEEEEVERRQRRKKRKSRGRGRSRDDRSRGRKSQDIGEYWEDSGLRGGAYDARIHGDLDDRLDIESGRQRRRRERDEETGYEPINPIDIDLGYPAEYAPRSHGHRSHRSRRSSRHRRHDEEKLGYELPTTSRHFLPESYPSPHTEPPPIPAHLYDDPSFNPSFDPSVDPSLVSPYPDLPYSSDSDSPSLPPHSATLIMASPGIELIPKPERWKIQGYYSLPETYTLAHLPPGTTLRPLSTSSAKREEVTVSNSYGVVKSFTGVIQIVSSLYTLYSAYGAQTSTYGYAAFGFSVLPYTVMSLLNTIANLVEASYDTLYLVRSDVMLEAERREHGEFIGEIAELVPASKEVELRIAGRTTVDFRFHRHSSGRWIASQVDDAGRPIPNTKSYRVHIPRTTPASSDSLGPTYIPPHHATILVQPVGQSYRFNYIQHKRAQTFRRWATWVIITFAFLVPYVVIGAISKFRDGERTSALMKVFMMGWLVSGQVIGMGDLVGDGLGYAKKKRWRRWEKRLDLGVVAVGLVLAVGGFVCVGRMLREFGYCVKL